MRWRLLSSASQPRVPASTRASCVSPAPASAPSPVLCCCPGSHSPRSACYWPPLCGLCSSVISCKQPARVTPGSMPACWPSLSGLPVICGSIPPSTLPLPGFWKPPPVYCCLPSSACCSGHAPQAQPCSSRDWRYGTTCKNFSVTIISNSRPDQCKPKQRNCAPNSPESTSNYWLRWKPHIPIRPSWAQKSTYGNACAPTSAYSATHRSCGVRASMTVASWT